MTSRGLACVNTSFIVVGYFVRCRTMLSTTGDHLGRIAHGAHGVVVSHPLRMRKALGSNPSGSTCLCTYLASPSGSATMGLLGPLQGADRRPAMSSGEARGCPASALVGRWGSEQLSAHGLLRRPCGPSASPERPSAGIPTQTRTPWAGKRTITYGPLVAPGQLTPNGATPTGAQATAAAAG